MMHLLRLVRATILCGGAVTAAAQTPAATGGVSIITPRDGALLPADSAPPVFRWMAAPEPSRWRLSLEAPGLVPSIEAETGSVSWRPAADDWARIKKLAVTRSARFRVVRLGPPGPDEATVSFRVSEDPIGAPILFREVPLPVGFAMDHKSQISWKLGDVRSSDPPQVVLTGMRTCANCHSLSTDGRTLAMDIDFGSDKSTYAIAEVAPQVRIRTSDLIAWNDFRREDGESTFGLLSMLSPDGRKAVSTVKETIFLHFLPDPFCSQLFFPTRGILVTYDRDSKTFQALAGAADQNYVQTNPSFSPDGRWLVFARADLPDIPRRGGVVPPEVVAAVSAELVDGKRRVLFDLYRLPFNRGQGGRAEPIRGASGNGQSNYFARYSPDGKWIVFCKASSMMLNRPDSELYIVPSAGGTPRRLRSNFPGRMNSWHSFSPNGRWLVFASKEAGPLTQLWLTHIDSDGQDSPPVLLDGFVEEGRAANLPEFVNVEPGTLSRILVDEEIRASGVSLPRDPRKAHE